MKRFIPCAIFIILLLIRCSINKDYQGKITKEFTALAGSSGKFKNDSLFRKTTVTLSTYSEFISVYNLQKTPKKIDKRYTDSFGNYATVLDSLNNSVPNNRNGYEGEYSKTMNYILADVKDKFINLCPKCEVQQYHPLLIDVKINVIDKKGTPVSGYKAFIEPVLAYRNKETIIISNLKESKQGIVPGYYKIWIEKNGIKISSKTEHIKNQSDTFIIVFQI